MSHDLFRKEALDARRHTWLGPISLAQPAGSGWLAAAAALVATLVVAFLLLGTYTRRSHVVGQLVPEQGIAAVLAPATGVIRDVAVREGERVAAGQVLAVLQVPRTTVAGGDTVAALSARLARRAEGLDDALSARLSLLDAQAEGLAGQRDAARRELARIEEEIATRREQVALATQSLGRLRELQAQGYVTGLQVDQQASAALEQQAELQLLQRQAESTRRLLAQVGQALEELPGQRLEARAAHTGALAQLEQEQLETEARGELAIVAPVAGVVASQWLKPGQAVQAGQSLLSVMPGEGRLQAELLVPSRAIGFISPGDAVLLRYQAYPYQKFGHHRGRVASVSRSSLDAGLPAPPPSAARGESLYRVIVDLEAQDILAYGQREALKPGLVLDADVLGETRTLAEWALEPLYSLRGTVSAP